MLTWLYNHGNHRLHYSAYPAQGCIVRILDAPEEKEKTWKVFADVQFIKCNDEMLSSTGKVLIYFKKDSLSGAIKYGDHIYIKKQPEPVPPPANPGEFDYKRYLDLKQVKGRIYASQKDWLFTGVNTANPVKEYALNLRADLISKLRKNLPEPRAFAVAAALLVGYDDVVDPELMHAFASSGTLHVLSVSGMHVGVIYMLIAALFGFAEKKKSLRNFYFPVLVLLIWSYAMISGLAASVIRASAMLSLVLLGKWMNFSGQMSNTMSGAMFMIFLFEPNIITDAGFQLSYLAVCGIVYIHPHIVKLFTPSNGFIFKIWELTSVSVAAQIATLPIGLLYFHQFPNLFIISNLLVIPLTTLSIYLCIITVFVSGFDFIANIISWLNTLFITWTNAIVLWIDNIPFAVTDGISITIAECILLYLIFIVLMLWMKKKTAPLMQLGLISLSIFISIQVYESYIQRYQQEFRVYKIGNHKSAGLITGQQHILFSDTLIDQQLIDRTLKNYFWEKNIKTTRQILLNEIKFHQDGKHSLHGSLFP